MTFEINKTFGEAFALHRAGRFAEAEPLYRHILAHNPQHIDSLHLLGVVCYELGRHAEALSLIDKAIGLNDRVANFHCNMGLVQFALGRREAAIGHYSRAITLEPRHALSFNNLGNALAQMGRLQEAEANLRRAIVLNPQYSDAHYNLGNVLTAQNKLNEAEIHYRRSLGLAPNIASVRNNLGIVLFRQGKLDEAAVEFSRVLESEPEHPGALYNLGNLLKAKADYDGAIAHYRKSLASRPEFADGWNNLGVALAESGDVDAARVAYEKAVQVEPARAAYHRNLANSKRFEPNDPQLLTMEALSHNLAMVPERERIDLQFALGKAYADLDQYERSFRCLLAGNALKRAQIQYSEALVLGYVDRIRKVFNADLLRAKAGGGDPTAKPIFIVGMPRSGTTLIEQIIASHPNAIGAGELFELDNIVQSLVGGDHSELRFPEVVGVMSGERLRQVGAGYLAKTQAYGPSAGRIVDKMPWNFHFVGLIRLALPNARIIHVRRNPVDTCLSCFSILFDEQDNPYTYDLAELGRFYRAYDALMAHWRRVLPTGVMMEIHYENVVEDLENQARQIISHCGLAWDDACLAFHKARRPVRTSSVAQVRQPIYHSSIGRWRPYREQLRPLLKELGIEGETESDATARPRS